MGKSPAAISRLPNLVAQCVNHSKQAKPTSRFQNIAAGEADKSRRRWKEKKTMESSSSDIDAANRSHNVSSSSSSASAGSNFRVPLSEVVSDCVKRWFKDTLKEAKAGDINMQVLVSQMYFSGYGVPQDGQKARIWMARAARTRSSVWRVSDKRPGYNASDSDSDELKGDS
ncbi:unnamed protein product [Linum tenue]|uniref:Uncharacterized protein n=1 Tax=Linum tenue TaxID=586396 RepID=A0AAV0KPM4_9ROSI|nr:unnamed protein product [Linum tenue]